MGLFSFLSSDSPNYVDKVWKASEFCLKGMMTDALRLITEGKVPIVVPYFSESQEKIIQFLLSNNVPHYLIETGESIDAVSQAPVVYVSSVKFFRSTESVDLVKKLSGKKTIQFLFFGHYPLPTKEGKFLERFSALKIQSIFYSSLDEPSFEIFGTTQIISVMEKLGLKDEEAIEHAMVTKAMERAREKIESKVKFEQEASSEREWFQKNVKG
ncbi:MAG: hypothetical protein HYR67_05595 [Bacteroidetes bacterium]|nr:hypothetical protein [Bacteroidota bacterium]